MQPYEYISIIDVEASAASARFGASWITNAVGILTSYHLNRLAVEHGSNIKQQANVIHRPQGTGSWELTFALDRKRRSAAIVAPGSYRNPPIF